MYVANVKNSIYLRSEPGENESNIIAEIPVGTQILWLENTNTVFSKISYNGMSGYVKRDYLSINEPQLNAANSGNTSIYKYMYVANVENSIYLRSSADGEANNIITTIPVGTRVGFIEHTNSIFSKINYKLLSKAEHMELNLTSFVNDPLSSLRTLVQLANCAELTKAGQLLCLLAQWSQGSCDWSFRTHC